MYFQCNRIFVELNFIAFLFFNFNYILQYFYISLKIKLVEKILKTKN